MKLDQRNVDKLINTLAADAKLPRIAGSSVLELGAGKKTRGLPALVLLFRLFGASWVFSGCGLAGLAAHMKGAVRDDAV